MFDSCSQKRCCHNRAEIESPRLGPRKCTKGVNEMRQDVRTHLVVAGADVSTYVRIHLPGIAPLDFSQCASALSCNVGQCTAPARVHNRHARTGRHEHDRNTVCEEEHQGDAWLAGDQCIDPRYGPHAVLCEGAATGVWTPNVMDGRSVHLLGADQLVPKALDPTRLQESESVLVDSRGRIANVGRKVEALKRVLAHAPCALAERDQHSPPQETIVCPIGNATTRDGPCELRTLR